MINLLDIRTVFISYSISNAICSIVMAFLWRQNRRRYPELGFWLANFVMQFFSILLITLRGILPDFISIMLANTLGAAAIILLYIGLEHFVGKVSSQKHNFILLAIFFLVHFYYTYFQNNLLARSINFSVATGLVCIQISWLLLRRIDVRLRWNTVSAGHVAAGFVVVSIFRIFLDLNSSVTNDLFESDLMSTLVILAFQMLYISLTFALFLMVNHRLVAELEQDILERKHAEQALKISEEKFSVAFQNIPDAIVITSLVDGKIIEANDGFFQITQFSKEDIVDKTTIDLNLWGSTLDREKFVKSLEEQGRIHNFETNFRKKTGSIFVGWISGEIIQLQELKCVLNVIRDITERKNTEQALYENYSTLHNILESTDALIFSINRQYCYTSFNSAHAATMKELYNQDIQLGGNLLDYMTVEGDRIIARHNIDRALAGEYLVEEAFSGDEGFSRHYFEVSHAPIITGGGEIFGVSIFSKDITERRQTELLLQHRLMELETVNRLSISLREGKNLQELLSVLLKEILKAVNATDGGILLLDPADNLLKLVESRGWFEARAKLSLNLDEGIVGQVIKSNELYVSLDLQQDPLFSQQTGAFMPLDSSGAFLPIRGENGTIGMLIVTNQLPRTPSENELRLLTIVAQIGANAISRSLLHDQIQLFNFDLQKEIHQKVIVQELLAAEKELLSTTLMSIADGVIVTDQDGKVILFNRAAESITGYTLSDAIRKPVNNVFKLHISGTLEVVPDVIKFLFDLEKAQKNQTGHRSPLLITHTGEKILVSGSITSLKSADENTVGFVIVFQNITEKQKVEAQTMLSQKMVAIGQLAAGIAHEINTPIQYVGDNIKFLGKAFSKYSETLAVCQQVIHDHLEKPITQDDLDQLDELSRQKKVSYYATEIPNAIQESLDGTERVRKIVLAMREFSHPSEKGKKLSDINHGIETTIVISRNEWKYCADLETDLDQDLPLVYCQIDEINQVVLNMIVNAAQAIQEKLPPASDQKGKILISTRKKEDKVHIIIQDTGSGVAQEIIERIFDPFFTTKGVGKGTGQGLSMAHNIIVEKHHGLIGVESEPGQGTTFTIELPVDSSELEQR